MVDGSRDAVPDVLIIGAGLAGGVAALTLVEAGFRVVCLEQGEWPDPAAYPGATPEWELLTRSSWSADPSVRRGEADYPIDLTDCDVPIMLFNGVGGSSVLFAAQWPRLHPSDFRTRTLDGVGDDWPLGWRDLWPYYEATDREFGVSGLSGDPAYPPTADYPLPPLPLGRAGTLVARGLDRLGWHWWPAANAIASRPYDGRRPCVQRGTCNSGCGEGAKGSADRTHWPKARARGVRIVTGARVRAIATSASGLATGASYVDRAGVERFQPAAVVLLAASGIGTPRLLLLSASATHPDGLANSSGLVGKRLMVHPRGHVQGLFDERFESWQGQAGASIFSYEFYESDPARGFARGAKWGLVPSRGPLGTALSRRPAEQVWGAALHERVERGFGHAAVWGINGEDLPEVSNAVSLSASLEDADRIAAPKITYRMSDNSRRLMAFHAKRAGEALEAAGAYRVDIDELTTIGNAHFMGTARMGSSPRDSVVDEWGRCHDVPNLYVIDSSVFVTGGGVNPSSTIAALAKRSVSHLVAERRNQVAAA